MFVCAVDGRPVSFDVGVGLRAAAQFALHSRGLCRRRTTRKRRARPGLVV